LLDLVIDPPGDPAWNMAADEQLIGRVRRNAAPPTLRIYGWRLPAVSLGRRQPPEDLPPEMRRGISVVRRPTGGGAVVHRLDELTYALAVSRSVLPLGFSLRQLACVIHRRFRDELVGQGWIASADLQLASEDSSGPLLFCFSSPVRGDLLYRGRKAAGSALRAWREAFLIQGSVQGLPPAREQLQEALREAVSSSLGTRCPYRLSKSEN